MPAIIFIITIVLQIEETLKHIPYSKKIYALECFIFY